MSAEIPNQTTEEIPEVTPASENGADEFNGWAERMMAAKNSFLDKQPQAITCLNHPGELRGLDRDRSSAHEAVYAACSACQAEEAAEKQRERLRAAGVPANLLHATFNNWIPRDKAEASHLEDAKAFMAKRRGFLFLLGNLGTGKTHLAVAVMRAMPRIDWLMFRTQSELLRELRATYGDPKARDPITRAQKADLLVIDDVGLGGSGADLFPMMSAILDHRHGERLPTIITANLDQAGLRETLGDRLADRLSESTFKALTFAGLSHRSERRSAYFDDE